MKVYIDETKKVVFSNLKQYITKEAMKGVISQDRKKSYYITRSISIHLATYGNAKEFFAENTKIKKAFKLEFRKPDSCGTVVWEYWFKTEKEAYKKVIEVFRSGLTIYGKKVFPKSFIIEKYRVKLSRRSKK